MNATMGFLEDDQACDDVLDISDGQHLSCGC